MQKVSNFIHCIIFDNLCWFCVLPTIILDCKFSVSNSSMQYGQNISIPYSQPQADNNMNMFNVDHKNNLIKTKMERDRDDGNTLRRKLDITQSKLNFKKTKNQIFSDQSTNTAKCKSVLANVSQSRKFCGLFVAHTIGNIANFHSTLPQILRNNKKGTSGTATKFR